VSKKYLKKIIAQSSSDLQIISACCFKAGVKLENIKYLKKNKIFLMSIERYNLESQNKKNKINSIIKFEYIESSKSKNIDQSRPKIAIKLIAIEVFKKQHNYEIILLFSNNAFITLTAEIIEVTLEDQKINDENN